MCVTPSCSVTPATCGRAASASCQSAGAPENSASTTSLPGNAVLEPRGRVQRGQLAVIHDGDAVAQLVGLVHVVRGQQNRQARLLLELLESSPRRWCARPDRGPWSARRERESSANAPARARFPAAAACRRKTCPPAICRSASDPRLPADSRISSARSSGGHAVKLGVNQQIFLGGQLRIGRQRLRNHADGIAHAVRRPCARRGPRTRAVPAVGGVSVVSMRISVVLPAPLGPSRPKISPCSTVKADVVHGHEIAEALGQFVDFDGAHLVFRNYRPRLKIEGPAPLALASKAAST